MSALFSLNLRYWQVASIVLLVAITALSLSPLPDFPAPDLISNDKLHHAIAYAALAFPVSLARPRHWWLVLAGFLTWSGTMEMLQPYVNRYGEWADLLANASGLALGGGLGVLLRRFAHALS
jgi:VanZ family protein